MGQCSGMTPEAQAVRGTDTESSTASRRIVSEMASGGGAGSNSASPREGREGRPPPVTADMGVLSLDVIRDEPTVR